MIERQELYCHDCNRWVQFSIDLSVDGNYVIECPECGHEHCRVVRNRRITDVRWDRRNGPTMHANDVRLSCNSALTSSTANNTWTGDLWNSSASNL